MNIKNLYIYYQNNGKKTLPYLLTTNIKGKENEKKIADEIYKITKDNFTDINKIPFYYLLKFIDNSNFELELTTIQEYIKKYNDDEYLGYFTLEIRNNKYFFFGRVKAPGNYYNWFNKCTELY